MKQNNNILLLVTSIVTILVTGCSYGRFFDPSKESDTFRCFKQEGDGYWRYSMYHKDVLNSYNNNDPRNDTFFYCKNIKQGVSFDPATGRKYNDRSKKFCGETISGFPAKTYKYQPAHATCGMTDREISSFTLNHCVAVPGRTTPLGQQAIRCVSPGEYAYLKEKGLLHKYNGKWIDRSRSRISVEQDYFSGRGPLPFQ